MTMTVIILVYLLGAIVLAYFSAGLRVAAIASTVMLVVSLLGGVRSTFLLVILALLPAILFPLSIPEVRRKWFTAPLLSRYRRVLPRVSPTEQVAIDAGTVGWEGELFSGDPDWQRLLALPRPVLSAEEQAFLDGPVEELCGMVDTWSINFHTADIPPQVDDYIRKQRFLGMIIPKEYGGLELSPVAQVAVLTRLFSVGSVIGNYVSVPNSLGPGELLVRYGTSEQKQHYLPRLATGEEIPCFALTAPLAGSDATSIPDTGVVCKGVWEGREIVGMRLTINKRYITLAPVATLIGLAFKLSDPDRLLGDREDYGITCALIPRETPGLDIGRRHYPIGDPFLNGPIRGKDIFVPLDYIIGGTEMAGQGWRMLIECLSTGRAISLPTIANCIARNTLATTGAYARIRRQFGLPIAEFEGVQKPLARMAGYSFIIHAATFQTAAAIAAGAKPAVPASILKYHCTEMARTVINDGMDIQGGKAIMKGPRNMLSAAYESVPVAITVEGANILTRNLMIFGQGAIRCHPYVLKEMQAAAGSGETAVREFDGLLMAHAAAALRNGARALVDAWTGSLIPAGQPPVATRRYYRQLGRLSAAFSLTADVAMLSLQASLKKREMLSARLGDLLANLYLASMVLKQYEDMGAPRDLRPVIDWSCQYLLHRWQEAMQGLLDNLPNRLLAMKLRFIVFGPALQFRPPSDRLEHTIAGLVTRDTPVRDWLTEGIYRGTDGHAHAGTLDGLLKQSAECEPLLDRIKVAIREGRLPELIGIHAIDAAATAGILNEEEAAVLREFDAAIMEVIHVDDFAYDAFTRTAD